MDNVIQHTEDVKVTGNEILSKPVLNRNIYRLLENDAALANLYRSIMDTYAILEWDADTQFSAGDLVWWRPSDQWLKQKLLSQGRPLMYVFRSMCGRNLNNPPIKNDGTFDTYWWQRECEHFNVLSETFGIRRLLRQRIWDKMRTHQDSSWHPFGTLTLGNVDQKLLRRFIADGDMYSGGNLNLSRKLNHYPYKVEFDEDDTVLNGYAMFYGNGFVTYDFVFRVGYDGKETVDGYELDRLIANNVQFKQSEYFSGSGNMIFNYANQSLSNFSIIGNTIQRNRNDYVNAYCAVLNFSKVFPFRNTDYMIFGSQVMNSCHDLSSRTLNEERNCLVFCDKTETSVKALYIQYPAGNFDKPGYNATRGGIVSNMFHCRVVGRYE